MSLFHRAVLRVPSALVYKPSAKSQIGKLSVCVFMKVGYPSLGLSAHSKSDIVQRSAYQESANVFNCGDQVLLSKV